MVRLFEHALILQIWRDHILRWPSLGSNRAIFIHFQRSKSSS